MASISLLRMFIIFNSVHKVVGMLQLPRGLPSDLSMAQTQLLHKASQVRQKLDLKLAPKTILRSSPIPGKKELFFPSSYEQEYGSRGFCNWLIPNYVMIGQYPGQTPENHGPREDEVLSHIDRIVNRGRIRFFISLQSEVPCQDDDAAWIASGGKVRLSIDGGREDFPNYFSHYAPLVRDALGVNVDALNSEVSFAHSPILDLNTPNSSSLILLLSKILDYLDGGECCEEVEFKRNALYIHCWGGRGRAGLVGACLLALIFPELDSDGCLEWVQSGYDSRNGSASMPIGLRRSPQTMKQRNFLKSFVQTLKIDPNQD